MPKSDKDLEISDYRRRGADLQPTKRRISEKIDKIERVRRLLSHAKLMKDRGEGVGAACLLAELIERLSGEDRAPGLMILIDVLELLGTIQSEHGEFASALQTAQSAESIRRNLLAQTGRSTALVEIGVSLTHLMVRAWLELGELDTASKRLGFSERELATLMSRADGTPARTDLEASQLRLEIALSAADPQRAVQLGERLLSLRRNSLLKFGRSRSQLERLADAVSWHADCLLVAGSVTPSATLYEEAVQLRISLVSISGSDNASLIALSSALVAAAQFNLYLGDNDKAEQLALDAGGALQQVQPDHLDFPDTYLAFTETTTELADILAQGSDKGCAEARRLLLAAIQAVKQMVTLKGDAVEASLARSEL